MRGRESKSHPHEENEEVWEMRWESEEPGGRESDVGKAPIQDLL